MIEGGFLSKDIIKVNGNTFIYKDEEYDYSDFLKISRYIKKPVFIILNQDIYVRKIKVNSKKIDEDTINKIKELEFGKEEDFLIDYEVGENKEYIYMYALREGEKISKLSKYSKELKVIPIQVQYKKKFEKLIHKKSYQCIFYYLDVFYYLNVENKRIKICSIYRKLDDALEFIKQVCSHNILYVGEGVNIKDNTINCIRVGDMCNDKILFK